MLLVVLIPLFPLAGGGFEVSCKTTFSIFFYSRVRELERGGYLEHPLDTKLVSNVGFHGTDGAYFVATGDNYCS
jgi:hypothetical protein